MDPFAHINPGFRDHAKLMFDGMGGPNGLLPADLMHLTDAQVENLFARPLAAMSAQLDRDRDADDKGDDDPKADRGVVIDGPDALRREWEELTGPMSSEFWESEYRKIEAERSSANATP